MPNHYLWYRRNGWTHWALHGKVNRRDRLAKLLAEYQGKNCLVWLCLEGELPPATDSTTFREGIKK